MEALGDIVCQTNKPQQTDGVVKVDAVTAAIKAIADVSHSGIDTRMDADIQTAIQAKGLTQAILEMLKARAEETDAAFALMKKQLEELRLFRQGITTEISLIEKAVKVLTSVDLSRAARDAETLTKALENPVLRSALREITHEQ